MKELEFKALMYGDIVVDQFLLEKGHYETDIPWLYKKEETMEKLVPIKILIQE